MSPEILIRMIKGGVYLIRFPLEHHRIDWNIFKFECWQLLHTYDGRIQSCDNTCYLICSLSHCVKSETPSVRNQSTDCPLVWITIAWHYESNHPIRPVGQFPRTYTGQLFPPLLEVGKLCDYCFCWGIQLSKYRPFGLLAQEHSAWFKPPPATCWHSWSLW